MNVVEFNYVSVRRTGQTASIASTVKVDHWVTVIWGLYWVIHAEAGSMHWSSGPRRMMMMLFAEETQLDKSLEEPQAKLDVSATPIICCQPRCQR
jgi:hypothetical protein